MGQITRRGLLLAAGGLLAAPARAERGGVGLDWLRLAAVAPLPGPGAAGGAAAAGAGAGAPAGPEAGAAAAGAGAGAGAADSGEDRIATLGAAFIAEVLGPRPRTPRVPARGAKGLRDLIASVESGPFGYDAVVYGAPVPPPGRPSRLTLDEISGWIAATPGQNHALGRYQIVPKTLRGLAMRLSLPGRAVFAPALQDRMADVLIADAGLNEFLSGTLPRIAFMQNLAAIWAGLPGPDNRSVYHGIAGNAAGMSWAEFRVAMARVFPE